MSIFNKCLNIILLSFLFFVYTNTSISQTLSEGEQDVKLKATELFKQKKYEEAIPYFSQLLSLYPKDPDYNYKYGVCLVVSNQDIKTAIKDLSFVVTKEVPTDVNYYLAEAYHLTYKFDDAIKYYNQFKAKASKSELKEFQVDRKIEMCNNGKDLIRYISDLIVLENKQIDKSDFYRSYEINDFGGNILVEPEEFKTKLDKANNEKSLMFLSNVLHSAYYASYGEKKENGKDIYRREKYPDGTWSEPENLGPTINSSQDENFPYMHPDGVTLYFSSKGHNSMGGYDIYKSVYDKNKGEWSKPQNLDFPTNSPYDDILFTTDAKEDIAYFASRRETSGDLISVYKIQVDKNPIEKEFFDINDVIEKSKLQVTPLANNLNANKMQTVGGNNSSSVKLKTEKINYNSYTFANLVPSETTKKEDVINESKSDAEIIKLEAKSIKNDADYAYVIANSKNQEAETKLKQAEDIKKSIDFITDENKKQEAIFKAKDLEIQADNLTKESITAYNIAKNLDKVASEKENEASKIIEFTGSLENNPNQDVIYLAEQVNQNRTNLNQSQEKYSTFDSELKNRKVALESESKSLEQKLVGVQNISKEVNNLKSELDKAKLDLDAPENEAFKETLQNRYNDLDKKYQALKQDEEKSIADAQKTRVSVDNLNSEVAFLQGLSSDLTNETKKEEIAQKITEVNKSDLDKQLTEKEFISESKTGDIIAETQKEKDVDELLFNSTKVLATASENSNNSEILLKQAETNNQVVDSLNLVVKNKQNELSNTQDVAKQEDLKKEIKEIEFLVDIKSQQAEKNLIEANAIEPKKEQNIAVNTIVEPVYASETGNKQGDYEKEVYKAQHFESAKEAYENNLNSMKQTLDTVSDPLTKEAIKKSIVDLENKIDESTILAENSYNAAQKIKSENPTEISESNISTIELLKKASDYKPENAIPLDNKQVAQIETAPEDKVYAEKLYSNYSELSKKSEDLLTQANTAEKASEKNKLTKEAQELSTKAQNEFHLFNETYALVNSEEFEVYKEVLENNIIVANNQDINLAHTLSNEADIYFNKAKTIRKNADLFEDEKQKQEELIKAKDLELLAIAKQKHAIDLYVKAKNENVQQTSIVADNKMDSNSENMISKDGVSTNEITLLYEEEENLKKFREKEYMAEALLTANNQNLEKLQKDKNETDLILNTKKKEKALEEIKKKEESYNSKIVEAYNLHGIADSLKYNVYKNQISQLASPLEDKSNKKILAKQYTREAEFYYTEARKIRQEGSNKIDANDKIADLRKATELEKRALSSQEIAVNAITDNNPVIFAANNDLVKLDILENLNKPVNTANVEAVEETTMLTKLNLKKDDVAAVENANQKQDDADIKMREANAMLRQAEDMKKLAATLTSNSAKKKSLKEAEKVQKKAENLQFNAAESYELVNNTKFSIFEDYVKKVRLNDNTNEARQGKLLEKQANQHFYKAKNLRDSYYMAAGTKKADYSLLEKAYNLELEAINEIKKASRIYLNMPALDSIEPKDTTMLVSKINEDMLIKKTADITPLGFATSDSLLAVKNAIETSLADNKTEIINEVDNRVIEEPVNKIEPVIENKVEPIKVEEPKKDLIVENKTEKVEPIQEKIEVEPVVEKVKPNVVEPKSNNGEQIFGFSVLGNSPYSDKNPIPINLKLPDCIIFKVQVGAFVNPIKQETFNGLYPMTGEKLANSEYTRYFVGLFRSVEATRLVLNKIKQMGYRDAFIVAYIDGNKVSPIQAENMIKAGKDQCVAGYNQVAQNEINMVNNQITSGSDVANGINTGATTNKTIAETVGRNLVQADDVTKVNGLLYTVQIGVYKEAPTADRLKNLSPLYQEQTATGFIRFTTGIFDKYESARTAKNNIVQLGITDAFVTAYRDGKKISLDEARSLENGNATQFAKTTNVSAPQNNTESNVKVDASDIIFKVQIGAYEKQVPTNVVTSLLKASAMQDFEQKVQNGITVYSVGKFKKYEDAAQTKNILVNENIPDAFVVAYKGNEKISVEEAKKLLNQ